MYKDTDRRMHITVKQGTHEHVRQSMQNKNQLKLTEAYNSFSLNRKHQNELNQDLRNSFFLIKLIKNF